MRRNRRFIISFITQKIRGWYNPYGTVTDLLSGRNYAPGEKIELRDWNVKVLVES